MAFGLIPLEKRIKENIKNYSLSQLFEIGHLSDYIECIHKITGMSLLLTDRHGEKVVCYGDFVGVTLDVINAPGKKIRVEERTVAHLYVRETDDGEILGEYNDNFSNIDYRKLLDNVVKELSRQAEYVYRNMETSLYADELEQLLEKEQYQVKHGEKLDPLTGVLNSTYFDSRLKVIDRSETVPVGVACININDWKYFNDKYGDEESDRLIQIVADIMKDEAKPEYVIGRCGGDFFYVVIPMAQDGETEEYLSAVQAKCDAFEDEKLAPSVACGMVLKGNVEQSLKELLSDAEYEMFDNKYVIKNAPGYRERLESK